MKTVIFNKENPKGIIKDIEVNTELFQDTIKQDTVAERLEKLEVLCEKFGKLLDKLNIK